MRYGHGTQVWVKCSDGVWWPAKVHALPRDVLDSVAVDACEGAASTSAEGGGRDEAPVDCGVEFYHNVGELYPVASHDSDSVQPLHVDARLRSRAEQDWFADARVRMALTRALHDVSARTATAAAAALQTPQSDTLADTIVHNNNKSSSSSSLLRADELRNVQSLLAAVGGQTAAQLRRQLRDAGVCLTAGAVRRQQSRELTQRKRARVASACALPTTSPSPSPPRTPYATETTMTMAATTTAATAAAPTHNDNGGDVGSNDNKKDDDDDDDGHSGNGDADNQHDSNSDSADDDDDDNDAVHFVECVDARVLDALRADVFDNAHRFVLPPTYRYRDVLGAVFVDNRNVTTSLPTPHAVCERPADGFAAQRRVLLVPLTLVEHDTQQQQQQSSSTRRRRHRSRHVDDADSNVDGGVDGGGSRPLSVYTHTTGWMSPVEVDGEELAMRLCVNGVDVDVPPHWRIAPGKAATAVKTALVVDITSLVLQQQQQQEQHDHISSSSSKGTSSSSPSRGASAAAELFTLSVGFTRVLPDTQLWTGFVACIYADARSVDELADDIVRNFRRSYHNNNRNHSHSDDDDDDGRVAVNSGSRSRTAAVCMTEASVSVRCPLTTLTMRVPVRSVHCEHVQCMELMAVLTQCVHSNVWNCPLCAAPMRPGDVWVNHRLREWLSTHAARVRDVDCVVETAPGQPLRARYRVARGAAAAAATLSSSTSSYAVIAVDEDEDKGGGDGVSRGGGKRVV